MRASLIGVLTIGALLAQAPVKKKASGATYDRTKASRCWDLKATGDGVQSTSCFVALMAEKSPALAAEGTWGVGKFEEAVKIFELALEVYPEDPYVRIRFGQMFWSRFNRGEAVKLISEALELDKTNAAGMLALAKILSKGFDSKATDLAKSAAEADPGLVEARELLAQLALENSDEKKAAEEANKALAINPKSLHAMAILGTIELLKNQPTDQFDKILAINPKYGEAWFWAGHHFILNRRYEEGIELYKKAVALKPDLWDAREQLGINLMRVGKPTEAREQLEMAYNAKHDSSEVVNSLRLMDSYKNFVSHKFEGGEVRLDKKEAAILQPYFEEEVRRARKTYEAKYKMHLNVPLEVEVYPNHEDFAVRTMGMPGLGATGVSFGPVVAMDSPSARKGGDYHWASTLWHELSHSYILVMSKFLVPRWFTEGISVHEETQASPEWGDPAEAAMLTALKEKKFLPVDDLDSGFVRPKDPMQIGLSYFQAGQALDWIVKTYGQDTVNAMVLSFAERKTTPEVIQLHLKLTPKEFDEKLDAFMRERFGKVADNLKEIRAAMLAATKALAKKDWDTAIAEGLKATSGYPATAILSSGYEVLAKAYTAKGDKVKAREILRQYATASGRDPESLKQLAQLEEDNGDKAMAAAALKRLIYISPIGDEDLHRKLGTYYLDLKQPDRALAAFQAQLASKPVDPAGAYYNLARSFVALSRPKEAQEAIFQSLELAPGFKPAQKLLLDLENHSSKD
ncbi:MAG: tetratricopeptide repeat protein [Acidobacteria bacterium]|nr:tetratricopeptide repeat protein [Acidobacteriota bacterium]